MPAPATMTFLARFVWLRTGSGSNPVTRSAPAIFTASRREMRSVVACGLFGCPADSADMNTCLKRNYIRILYALGCTRRDPIQQTVSVGLRRRAILVVRGRFGQVSACLTRGAVQEKRN